MIYKFTGRDGETIEYQTQTLAENVADFIRIFKWPLIVAIVLFA